MRLQYVRIWLPVFDMIEAMRIYIVNDDDEIIGTKERSLVDEKTDIYRASALLITNSRGQVLLSKRTIAKAKDPGKWMMAVSGTVEDGETYESNIYKEAKEEIGLENVPFTLGVKIRSYEPRNYFTQWYTVMLDRDPAGFTLQKEEVDEVAWIDIATLKQDLQNNPNMYVPSMCNAIQELGL